MLYYWKCVLFDSIDKATTTGRGSVLSLGSYRKLIHVENSPLRIVVIGEKRMFPLCILAFNNGIGMGP